MTVHHNNWKFIDNDSDLVELCSSFKNERTISLDTEFIRKGAAPLCCLVQFATKNHIGVIDPFKVDLLVFNKSIQHLVKIFHDNKQDIECLNQFGAINNENIFDTQVAELFLDYYDSRPSYKDLVKKYCDITLDKKMTMSKWEMRPFTDSQLEYALDDVEYLYKIYEKQTNMLETLQRVDFFKTFLDHEILHKKPKTQEPDIVLELKKLLHKVPSKLNSITQDTLYDAIIESITKSKPKTIKEFYKLGTPVQNIPKNIAVKILSTILFAQRENALEIKKNKNVSDMLRVLLNINCTISKISPIVIASSKDILNFIVNNSELNINEFQQKIFFNDATNLLEGKITLQIDKLIVRKLYL